MPKLFLDLDGTLIDPRRRLYRLFCELLPESTLSFDGYWEIKRRNTTQQDILQNLFHYSSEKINLFRQDWMRKIEEPARLEQDAPIEGAEKFLRQAAQTHNLYLVTARQRPDLVEGQLERLRWKNLFSGVLVTGGQHDKAALIRDAGIDCGHSDILIGDTGDDIKAGKTLKLRTIAVTSGILGRPVLEKYAPDMMFDSVGDIPVELLNSPAN